MKSNNVGTFIIVKIMTLQRCFIKDKQYMYVYNKPRRVTLINNTFAFPFALSVKKFCNRTGMKCQRQYQSKSRRIFLKICPKFLFLHLLFTLSSSLNTNIKRCEPFHTSKERYSALKT